MKDKDVESKLKMLGYRRNETYQDGSAFYKGRMGLCTVLYGEEKLQFLSKSSSNRKLIYGFDDFLNNSWSLPTDANFQK